MNKVTLTIHDAFTLCLHWLHYPKPENAWVGVIDVQSLSIDLCFGLFVFFPFFQRASQFYYSYRLSPSVIYVQVTPTKTCSSDEVGVMFQRRTYLVPYLITRPSIYKAQRCPTAETRTQQMENTAVSSLSLSRPQPLGIFLHPIFSSY